MWVSWVFLDSKLKQILFISRELCNKLWLWLMYFISYFKKAHQICEYFSKKKVSLGSCYLVAMNVSWIATNRRPHHGGVQYTDGLYVTMWWGWRNMKQLFIHWQCCPQKRGSALRMGEESNVTLVHVSTTIFDFHCLIFNWK